MTFHLEREKKNRLTFDVFNSFFFPQGERASEFTECEQMISIREGVDQNTSVK